jgi:hypothetical protein
MKEVTVTMRGDGFEVWSAFVPDDADEGWVRENFFDDSLDEIENRVILESGQDTNEIDVDFHER